MARLCYKCMKLANRLNHHCVVVAHSVQSVYNLVRWLQQHCVVVCTTFLQPCKVVAASLCAWLLILIAHSVLHNYIPQPCKVVAQQHCCTVEG